MAAISNVNTIKLIDKYTAAMLTLCPSVTGSATGATTPGFGDSTIAKGGGTDYGLQLKLRDAETLLLAMVDAARITNQFNGLESAIATAPQQSKIYPIFSPLIQNLNTDCVAAALTGATTLDLFCSYYNTGGGGSWQALCPPDWRTLFNLIYGVNPSPFNVYAPPVLASTGLGTGTAGTWANGSTVDTTKYAGHIQIFGVITSSIVVTGGAAVIKLSGNGFTANGTLGAPTPFTGDFTSHVLTSQSLVAGTYTAGTILTFTGTSANDIYTAITGLQNGGTITTPGNFWVGGMSPTAAPASAPAGVTGTNVPATTTRTSPPV